MSEFLHNLYGIVSDYGHVFIIAVAVILVILIIVLMKKYMPSKGRITDLFDENGNRKDKKDEKK